jgi:hexosaminidase
MQSKTILTLCFLIMILTVFTKGQSGINIIPKPSSIKTYSGDFKLDYKTIIVYTEETRNIASLLNDWLLKNYGFKLMAVRETKEKKNLIVITTNGSRGLLYEGYKLVVSKKTISIIGRGAGLFYGLQSLMQLLPVDGKVPFKIPCAEIIDQPRFRYRGMHLDVGRHFQPVEFIKKYLDLMAQYKMNTFHWHLTEDQGWRIEIKKYPKLTAIGSKRKETVKGRQLQPYVGDGIPYQGFYTQEEIKEVVAYAKSLYITVIPEIEMPGHSLAVIASYPELACTSGPFEVGTTWGVFKDIYCPKEETFKFLEDVLSEVVELFPAPYVHLGGDEAPKDRWKESPIAQEVIKREGLKDEHELQSYFIRRIEKFLNSKGKRLIGWDEILEGGLAPNATVMSWRGEKGGIEAAKQKHDVIMTPTDYCYFDYGQGDPKNEPINIGGYLTLKKVYSYNPTPPDLTKDEQQYILGAQGNVWTEYLKTPESVEYMVFPRMLALSEVVWTPLAEKNYDDFLLRLSNHFARLDRQNVNYRIPEPMGLNDVVTTDDKPLKIQLVSQIPNSKIYYTLDGSVPNEKSKLYKKEFEVPLKLGEKANLNVIIETAKGRKSSMYSATLLRRSFLEAVDFTGDKQGLNYKFYEGQFDSVKDIEKGTPVSSGETKVFNPKQFNRPEMFGAVFEGYLKVTDDGLYRLAVESDDGSALLINDEEIIVNDGVHTMQKAESVVPLKKGFHKIKVLFFQRTGEIGLRVGWGKNGQPLGGMSSSVLFH